MPTLRATRRQGAAPVSGTGTKAAPPLNRSHHSTTAHGAAATVHSPPLRPFDEKGAATAAGIGGGAGQEHAGEGGWRERGRVLRSRPGGGDPGGG